MAPSVNRRVYSIFLVAVLAATLVLGAILPGCSRGQTTTSAVPPTTTSAPASTTTSASTRTTTSAPATTTTTSAPAPSGISAAEFYKTNVVTIVVPYAPGGTVDYASRVFSSLWTETTGGRMIVENRPGAGGLIAANYVYAARPDGLTMGVSIPGAGLIAPVMAQDPAIKFDLKKMNWIIFTNPDWISLAISAKLPYTSMAELSKVKGLKFASSTRNVTGTLVEALAADLFGLQDARIVLGYGGAAEAFLAVGKGEVDGYATGNADFSGAISHGYTKTPFVTFHFQRSPYFPDVPAVPELITLSPAQQALLQTISALVVGQAFWYQPGVAQDRIDYVRKAFDQIAASDAFLKQAKTVWPIAVKPVAGKDYGAELQKLLAFATPDSYIQLQKLVDKYIP